MGGKIRLEVKVAAALVAAAAAWLLVQFFLPRDPAPAAGPLARREDGLPVVTVRTVQPMPFQTVTVLKGATAGGPVSELGAPYPTRLTGYEVAPGQRIAAGRTVAHFAQPGWVPDLAQPRAVKPTLNTGGVAVAAPVDGLVIETAKKPGAMVAPGTQVAHVMRLEPMQVVAEMNTRQAARVGVGQGVTAELANGTAVSGTVRLIGPVLSRKHGDFQVIIDLERAATPVASGLDARVVVPGRTIEAYRLPHDWLVGQPNGQATVMTVVSGSVVPVPVRLLADSAEGVWLQGLPAGAQVVSRAAHSVRPGMAVHTLIDKTAEHQPAGGPHTS